MSKGSLLRAFVRSQFLEYETPKIVHLRSPIIGVLFRLVQLAIVLYIVLWMFWYNRGYQYFDNSPTSATTVKVKGVAYTNSTDIRVGDRVWDNTDLIVPPQDNGAFFVTTNAITTHNQTQGVCAEARWVGADCKTDEDCLPVGKPYHLGNGVSTGICNQETGTCKVRAWCPLEDDSLPNDGKTAILDDSKDFTVLIKSHVHFPYYKTGRSNLIESVNKTYIHRCNYHPITDPYCPIFRLGDMVSLAETSGGDREQPPILDDSYYEQLAIKGGVITVTITWDCDLDYSVSKCKPEYSFARLDNYNGNDISTGFNFRYTMNFMDKGVRQRNLIKAYGVLFVVNVDARARAFEIVTFLQNLGSGLALLGIASVLCDIFLVNFHRKKSYFKKHIYYHINEDKLSEKDRQRIADSHSNGDSSRSGSCSSTRGSQLKGDSFDNASARVISTISDKIAEQQVESRDSEATERQT